MGDAAGGLVKSAGGEAAAGATNFFSFRSCCWLLMAGHARAGISRTVGLLVAAVDGRERADHLSCRVERVHRYCAGVVCDAWPLCAEPMVEEQSAAWAILIAIFLGAALSIKLTAVFVFAAFALVILLRAREAESSAGGQGHRCRLLRRCLLAGVIASPWYMRTWNATGSPVFPFYMSIWQGKANGWDVERSNLFQAMNSQYGGADTRQQLNYLTAPCEAVGRGTAGTAAILRRRLRRCIFVGLAAACLGTLEI